MISVDIICEDDGWRTDEVLTARLTEAICLAAKRSALPIPPDSEVSLVLGNDAMIRGLNAQWRKRDKPTNVLSFAANDGLPPEDWSPLLGDIIIARETVEREADGQGKSFDDHLLHLAVHGMLHLLGLDHQNDADGDAMEALETRILAEMGIPDPYQ